jgi:hypothetical protein
MVQPGGLSKRCLAYALKTSRQIRLQNRMLEGIHPLTTRGRTYSSLSDIRVGSREVFLGGGGEARIAGGEEEREEKKRRKKEKGRKGKGFLL